MRMVVVENMDIVRVINNNNVCVVNEKGKELIVSGKGIGFSKKPGDKVEASQIQKTYLIADSKLQERLIYLLSEIPHGYVEFTNDLVEHIREVIPEQLNESLLITLSDHLFFAIKRKRKGIEFSNPMLEALRTCYPDELDLGYYCLEQIKNRLKVEFIPDEAGFIAMHIINARLETGMSEVYGITSLINICSDIAMEKFPFINKNAVSYERYMVHIKYLAQRIFKNDLFSDYLTEDKTVLVQLSQKYPEEYECAQKISDYVAEIKKARLTEDELFTLVVHIVRMTQERRKI